MDKEKMMAAFEAEYPAASRARRGDDYGGAHGSMFVVWQAAVASCAPVQAQGVALSELEAQGGMHGSMFVKVWGDAGGGDAGREALAKYAYDLGMRAALDQAKPVAREVDDTGLREAVGEGLKGLYGCGRVWSAWQVGTMRQDDFYLAEDSDECIDQVMDAIRPFFAIPPAKEG